MTLKLIYFILSIDGYFEIDGRTCNILNGDFNCALDKKNQDKYPSRAYDEPGTKGYGMLF